MPPPLQRGPVAKLSLAFAVLSLAAFLGGAILFAFNESIFFFGMQYCDYSRWSIFLAAPALALLGIGAGLASGSKEGAAGRNTSLAAIALIALAAVPTYPHYLACDRAPQNDAYAIHALHLSNLSIGAHRSLTGDLPDTVEEVNADLVAEGSLRTGAETGYQLIYTPGPPAPDGTRDRYTLLARPIQFGTTGRQNFFTDETEVVRRTVEDRPATADDVRVEDWNKPAPQQQKGAAMSLTLTSSAFQPGGNIPKKFTCDGPDVSPALQWSDPPAATQSFALILDDPDAPVGTWVHWVLYDLPATARALPENVAKQDALPDGSLQGANDFRRIGYGGPCPPYGATHRYFFKLYALDAKLNLKSGASKADLEAAMKSHILAHGELIGRYKRSPGRD